MGRAQKVFVKNVLDIKSVKINVKGSFAKYMENVIYYYVYVP